MDLHFDFVDVLVVLVVLVSAGYATWRGFVRETLSIFAWVAAAFATLYFGPAAAGLLKERVSPELLGIALGYAGVFLLVLIPLSFVSFRFAEGVHRSPVGAVDRALGFAFGVVRGLAVIGLGYIIFTSAVETSKQPEWLTRAHTLPLIQSSAQVLLALVPDRDGKDSPFHTPPASAGGTAAPGMVPQPRPNPRAASQKTAKHGHKAYGARDRRALDNLIQQTNDGGGKQ
ncbi:MAG TPA: CvpA family protein [Rhizomicrobium sp.]|jgi:membrane protein required for colicin V production|nr:CvpA family protein [Rhizomicrobium sp.]